MRTSVLVAGLFALLLIGCAAQPRAHVEITPYTPPAPDASALAKALPEGHTAGTFVDVAEIRIVGIDNAKAPKETDYLTLHEALEAKLCTVAEKDGVNGLAITNRAKQPIFLMVGDLVLGGKQDRIMAESIVVEAGADGEIIPVFCVEHGRWSEEAGSSEFYARAKSQQADVSVKSAAIQTASQGDVWDAVAENNTSLGVSGNTSTGTFRATFDDPETAKKLDAMYEKARTTLTGDTVGFAVIYKDEVVAMDTFDSKGLCAKLSEKLLRSYLVTAISSGYDPAPKHPLRDRLEDLVTMNAESVQLSLVVEELNRQWSVNIGLEGGRNPKVTLVVTQTPMLEVLTRLSEAGKFPVYIGRGSVLVDARQDARTSEEQLGPRVYAGMPVSFAFDTSFDDESGQFENGSGGTAPANPTSGIFFNNQDPNSPPVNFNQQVGNRFERGDAWYPLNGRGLDGQRLGRFTGSNGGGQSNQTAVPTNNSVNASTETEREYGDDGVDYSCKDKRRDSTIHRAFMRR